MKTRNIDIDEAAIQSFCTKYHIRSLALFGSVLRDDFGPESDVDVLVEFEPGHVVGLITLAGLENELSEIFGRQVDLNTPGGLSPYFREAVLLEQEALYVAACAC